MRGLSSPSAPKWVGHGPTHQCLHVVHSAQMVPDDLGWHLAPNILAELVSNTNHVEVPIHPCQAGQWVKGRSGTSVQRAWMPEGH